jgi:anti-sigma factor RsiW
VTGAEDRWKILERIGAYAAGELLGEEAQEVERFVLKNAEAHRLAASCDRMLTLLRTIDEESPEVPLTVIDHTVRQTVGQARACQGPLKKVETRCSKERPKNDAGQRTRA